MASKTYKTPVVTPESAIRDLLHQACDPREWRKALAARFAVSVEEIDKVIESVGGTPRQVSEETVAQETMRAERAYAKTHPEYDHEED